VDKGFSLLEWSSKLVPQGALVTGELDPGAADLARHPPPSQPHTLLGTWDAAYLAPHLVLATPASLTGAKQGWRLGWQTMVRELAPQDSGGAYTRPQYSFDNEIGSSQFPVGECVHLSAIGSESSTHEGC
jgi:hypothetical protein